MGKPPIIEVPLAHADAVLVLGALWMDRGSEAARLYGKGISDRFLFSPGHRYRTPLGSFGH
ncbi:MAG: hypothetical protein IPL86_00010 [Flavobacteriales bacterium]|nr:hypothetical protein [Flavobacteriales bacterium]